MKLRKLSKKRTKKELIKLTRKNSYKKIGGSSVDNQLNNIPLNLWDELTKENKEILRKTTNPIKPASKFNKSSWNLYVEEKMLDSSPPSVKDSIDKFIFLDCDGVLHPSTREGGSSSGSELNKENVDLILRLRKETGAKIVLSSNWRFNPKLVKQLLDRKILIDSGNPNHYMLETNYADNSQQASTAKEMNYMFPDERILTEERGKEILSWIKNNAIEESNYVIIDDKKEEDLYHGLSESEIKEIHPHFIHTNYSKGFILRDYNKCLEALEGSPSKKRSAALEAKALEKKLIALDFDQTISVKVPPMTFVQTWKIAGEYRRGKVDKHYVIKTIFGGEERKEKFKKALQQQKDKGNNIIILTNNERTTAEDCLQAAELDELIGGIYGNGDWSRSKGHALEKIRGSIDLENIILFDDDRDNCTSVIKKGMKCYHVKGEDGMQTKSDFEALANF